MTKQKPLEVNSLSHIDRVWQQLVDIVLHQDPMRGESGCFHCNPCDNKLYGHILYNDSKDSEKESS